MWSVVAFLLLHWLILYLRDLWYLPQWPQVHELPQVLVHEYNLKTQINEYVDKICPHMGCLYNLCLLHSMSPELHLHFVTDAHVTEDFADPISGYSAHVKCGVLQRKIQRPCGDMCCILDRVGGTYSSCSGLTLTSWIGDHRTTTHGRCASHARYSFTHAR